MDEEYYNPEEQAPAKRQSLLERLRSRSLGDIRIHDSEQAGQLARKLGARAFTVGRDIYVRPELVKSGSREGEALLAHELYHVTEQTSALQAGPSAADMPLLRPPASHGGGATAVQRMAGQMATSTTIAPAGLSPSESRAESIESATRSSGGSGSSSVVVQRAQSEQKPESGKQSADAEQVAEKVYDLIMRDLILDKERGV